MTDTPSLEARWAVLRTLVHYQGKPLSVEELENIVHNWYEYVDVVDIQAALRYLQDDCATEDKDFRWSLISPGS